MEEHKWAFGLWVLIMACVAGWLWLWWSWLSSDKIIHNILLQIFKTFNNMKMNKKKNRNIYDDDHDNNNDDDDDDGSKPVIPEGNTGWPLIGETYQFIASGCSSKPATFLDERKSKYGKVFKTHILGTRIIVSTDPEVNKAILQNHGNMFIPAYPKSVSELFGKYSILQMNGIPHKRLHTLIASFFKSPQFKANITSHIENSVKHNLSSWRSSHSSTIYVHEQTKKIAFEILVRVLVSIGHGEELNLLMKEFEEFMKGLICLPIKLPGTTFYKSLKAKERLLKMVRNIVEKRKLMLEKSDDKCTVYDAIDLLLRHRHSIFDSNHKQSPPLDFICSNIIEMMIPGEETVPMAMTLAVKFLTDCPVTLKKLVEENMELKRRKGESDYSWSDYMSLQFTQNVINETLRLGNIINAVWRKALKDVEIKGHLIPQGWCVLASFTSIHMDEENYVDPYEFNPWRWDKTGGGANNNNFTPFGGGQRLCPGLDLSKLEISIFLHHLVTTYRWTAENDEIIYFPTLKMKRKLPIIVTPISTN